MAAKVQISRMPKHRKTVTAAALLVVFLIYG